MVRPSRLPRGVHHAVGRQANLLLTSTAFAPMWAVRLVNNRITESR